jgi:glycerate-2-kinase
MGVRREFRRVTFDRKLDVKRLQAILSQTMREAMKKPSPQAAPARVESILIQSGETTVYLSGNGAGLDAVAEVLRSQVSKVNISKATRADTARPPQASPAPSQRKSKA